MNLAVAIMDPFVSFTHVTVLRSEVVQLLSPESGALILDLTAGGGGHSAAILEANQGVRVVAFDRDPAAVTAAEERLREFGERATVVRAAFSEVEGWLASAQIDQVDGLVADLGVSSQQLSDSARGLSFRLEGPLDMRMDPDQPETALSLIERLSQDELADVIYQLGEERRSRRVARCIKQALEAGELATTTDLRRAVVRAVGPRRLHGIDPATRTFQALRIAVNAELQELSGLLELATRILRPGGNAAFISFHSLEDRLVKRAFLDREVWQRVTKKPIIASETEQVENPRSRSAKLRAARRLPLPEGPLED